MNILIENQTQNEGTRMVCGIDVICTVNIVCGIANCGANKNCVMANCIING